MNIYCNIDPLKAFTTGTPSRGMLPELMGMRSQDRFILGLKKGSEKSDCIKELLGDLKGLSNWKLYNESISSRQSNLLNVIGYGGYNRTQVEADLYINFDADDVGSDRRPVVTLLADLSVLRRPEVSTHGFLGRLIRRNCFDRMTKFSDRIVVISKFTENDLLDLYPDLEDRTVCIYNGIDDLWFSKPRRQDKTEDRFWIWWGFISPRKNLENLLTAYNQALLGEVASLPGLRLITSGDTGNLFRLVREYRLEDKVTLMPSQSLTELIDLVDQSMGLVFPSYYEGFGLPVIEAMSRGKQVICSHVSALPEVSGNLGVYFNPNDCEDIRKALVRSSKAHPEEDFTVRRKWAQQFTYKNSARNYCRIIDDVLGI